MEFKKPDIVETPEKITAKYSGGLDSDGDSIASVSYGVFVEVDKKEALDEAVQKIVASNAPDWLKNAIKGK